MTRVTPFTGSDSVSGASHLCHHRGCGRWGSWGFDGGEGISGWWCLEHRPDEDPVQPVVEQGWVSDGNEG